MPDPRKFLYEITKINISDIQVQADEVATDSDENHDYLIYIEDIDTIKAYKDDNKIKIETKHEVVDRYTGEDETDRIKFPVSTECKFINYGEESLKGARPPKVSINFLKNI